VTENKNKKTTLTGLFPFMIMGVFLLLVQIISVMLAQPMIDEGMQFTKNPESVWNSIYYLGLILGFTVVILYAFKKNIKWFIHGLILFSVGATLYYIFLAIFAIFMNGTASIILSLVLSFSLTVLLYRFPEWYVINIIGILIGAGVAAIIGISFGVIPALILLILLAVYDAISVYRTKHMLVLAEGVMDMKVPILFVIPNHLNFSFREYKYEKDAKREAFFMGLGDAIMPTILVISANVFITEGYMNLTLIGLLNMPALGAALGTFVGFAALMMIAARGNPQAGLPFLNTGAILGYVAGCLAAGVSIIPL
jgi:presenilin-like A22 family membrane protease